MKVPRFLLVILSVTVALSAGLRAEKEPHSTPPAKADEKKSEEASDKKHEEKEKEVKPREVRAQVTLSGRALPYLAQTGTMPVLKADGAPRANVFYIYYAATDANGTRLSTADQAARPVTFCFNGGPGAAAVWLHLGGLGPKRLDLAPDGLTPATVVRTVDNPNTILESTDLVFIDPVSTGLSRAAKGEKADHFFGVQEDFEAVGEFIRLFTTREQRWLSPKYLCGESYGVIRAAGVVDYLQQKHGMYFEGLMLMSGLLNFQTISPAVGNDLPFVLSLPALAATAHYHHRLANAPALDVLLGQVRAFAEGDYMRALLKGETLEDKDRRNVAEQLARFTGLTPGQITDQKLRIDNSYFREWLLRSEQKILGRFDARVTAQDASNAKNSPEFDPALSNIIGAFSAGINAYIRGDLGYESDHPYGVLVPLPWRYTQYSNRYLSVENPLADAMKNNPRLRLIVLLGQRDLAVPADAMRFSLAHLPIPASLRGNITVSEYESGHMMYLFRPDAEKLRRDLSAFVRNTGVK